MMRYKVSLMWFWSKYVRIVLVCMIESGKAEAFMGGKRR
jgi:hypothetical protein